MKDVSIPIKTTTSKLDNQRTEPWIKQQESTNQSKMESKKHHPEVQPNPYSKQRYSFPLIHLCLCHVRSWFDDAIVIPWKQNKTHSPGAALLTSGTIIKPCHFLAQVKPGQGNLALKVATYGGKRHHIRPRFPRAERHKLRDAILKCNPLAEIDIASNWKIYKQKSIWTLENLPMIRSPTKRLIRIAVSGWLFHISIVFWTTTERRRTIPFVQHGNQHRKWKLTSVCVCGTQRKLEKIRKLWIHLVDLCGEFPL